MLVELSLPRCGAFGFDRPVPNPPKPEPPKKLLKISPKSKSIHLPHQAARAIIRIYACMAELVITRLFLAVGKAPQ